MAPEPSRTEVPAPPLLSRRAALVEGLVVFAGATLACAVLWQLRGLSSVVNQNLQAFIAAIFLWVPTAVLWRRQEDFAAFGLTHRPLRRGLLAFLLTSAIVFPLFGAGFLLYYRVVCRAAAAGTPLPRQIRSLCRRFVGGLAGARLRLPPGFGEVAAAQLLVVGLPEEYFFRGYLQTRLERVWPSRRRLLGAPVGVTLPLVSALFALGHLFVDGNGLRLAVFFPGLVFGWLRQSTGSILAGVLFHASSNVVSELLHSSFF